MFLDDIKIDDTPKWYNTFYMETEEPDIDWVIWQIEKQVNKPAVDGIIKFHPKAETKFTQHGGMNGYKLDREYYKKTGTIKIVEVSPKDLVSQIHERSSYSTRFDLSNYSRSNNIELSSECFNGITIPAGGEISFNEIVGPRTVMRGYGEANIIIDGEFVKGIGGGVCQTSTTLFNAALLAGLDTVSTNHSLPISYVPIGRDAMVSSCTDLVIQNNTGGNIYIESYVEQNRVYFNFYGKSKNGVVYKPTTNVTEKDIKTKIEGDLRDGERVIIQRGIPERIVTTYLEAHKGSKLVQKRKLRTSRYKGREEIVKFEPIVDNLSDDMLKSPLVGE